MDKPEVMARAVESFLQASEAVATQLGLEDTTIFERLESLKQAFLEAKAQNDVKLMQSIMKDISKLGEDILEVAKTTSR